jgi:hypothetical protein
LADAMDVGEKYGGGNFEFFNSIGSDFASP